MACSNQVYPWGHGSVNSNIIHNKHQSVEAICISIAVRNEQQCDFGGLEVWGSVSVVEDMKLN